ncbi:M28 family metallopeptidase [Promethearchaeum syntrophicum]|uniref:M28 family metallopeptidase n=1 Tax=Promethearchaeum syntrophicum TaxID=2594042 RepID=A0A5B9D7W4_9ARCH|nr:M28 family peptidase [Candidatus Prometheoarchaeum syntrophicum]QEE15214.1 Peptidase family M28 [Candidatus Prometheoarchaeum syntrophicum]
MGEIQINSTDTNDVLQFTGQIIEKFGPRLTGDTSTKKAADLLKNEFGKYCDSTELQEFDVHPKTFLGWIKLLVIIFTIGIIFLWLDQALITAIGITIGIIIMIMEFFLYYEFVDFLWKKKKGYNVIGKIEPKDEVKQQIIISGHIDSAYIFNFFIHQPKLYALKVMGGIGFVVLMFLGSWVWVIIQAFTGALPATGFSLTFKILMTVSLILVVQLYFFSSSKGTPGAGDNLVSVCIADKVGKKFSEQKKSGKGLKNTRLVIAGWDGEECGLRGARAYVKKNLAEMKAIPTFNFNMDCPYLLKDLFFLTSDVNCSVKLSENMAMECKEISDKLGYPATLKPIEFLTGGTDAGEFGRYGIEATTLVAMPWGGNDRYDAYHTPKDVVSAIEPEVVEASLKIICEYITKKDMELN